MHFDIDAFLRKIFFREFVIMSLILLRSLNRCNVDQSEHSNKLKVKQIVCIVFHAINRGALSLCAPFFELKNRKRVKVTFSKVLSSE